MSHSPLSAAFAAVLARGEVLGVGTGLNLDLPARIPAAQEEEEEEEEEELGEGAEGLDSWSGWWAST